MKKTVAVLCGGKSTEHEVSLVSGKNIALAVDRNIFDVQLFSVSKDGKWFHSEKIEWLPSDASAAKTIKVEDYSRPLGLIPGGSEKRFYDVQTGESINVDVIFPIIHGTLGEDGTLQGLLRLLDIPFVGCDTMSSAIGMDKDIMKRLLREAKIQTAKAIIVAAGEKESTSYEQIRKQLGSTVFIKPACLGSSVGVSKVRNEKEFNEAVEHAFSFDTKIVIEEEIKGREIECAVLGNENPQASTIGEIKPTHDFYSYEAKYIDENGAELIVPAELSPETEKRVRQVAVDAYKVLCCEGLARVDMFLREDGEIFMNEVNTLPGFTKISMYPRLWVQSGISYSDLITKLIGLAVERYNRQKRLKSTI